MVIITSEGNFVFMNKTKANILFYISGVLCYYEMDTENISPFSTKFHGMMYEIQKILKNGIVMEE